MIFYANKKEQLTRGSVYHETRAPRKIKPGSAFVGRVPWLVVDGKLRP